jgi:hypothetical protein
MLLTLFKAIAARDARTVRGLLSRSPQLATEPLDVGATRAAPIDYFLVPIAHYAYAGDTALHIAAASYDVALVRELLAKGALVDARNRRGAEPLHYACDGGPNHPRWNPRAQADVIARLVKAGANPDALDRSGVAPIHRAVRCRTTGAVRALIAAGADPVLRNKSGSTPMDLATQTTGKSGSGSLAARREQKEIIDLLVAASGRRR